jgi:hypothetical protein
MAQAVTAGSEADDIQRQMREVRAELRDDVKDLMNSTQDLRDWTRYVRAYPWLCVGLAAAAGYVLVPSRPMIVHPDPESLFKLAKEHKLVMKPEDGAVEKRKGGLVSKLVSVAMAAALQGGMRIVTQQLTEAMSAAANKPHSNGRPGVHHA